MPLHKQIFYQTPTGYYSEAQDKKEFIQSLALNKVNGVINENLNKYLEAYDGVNAEITNGVPLNSKESQYFSAVTTNESPAGGIKTRMKPFSLSAGVTKVRVYMWVEGQDVDCEDNASGGTVSYNLSFSIDETGN